MYVAFQAAPKEKLVGPLKGIIPTEIEYFLETQLYRQEKCLMPEFAWDPKMFVDTSTINEGWGAETIPLLNLLKDIISSLIVKIG